jgi:hypothetical protein
MKIDFLLKWWYKGDNLTEIVKSENNSLDLSRNNSLDLSRDVIKAKVTAILNHPSFQGTWFKGAMKRAIKSTLKEVIRNEKAVLIVKEVCKISKWLPKETIETPTALQQDQRLNKLTNEELELITSNCNNIARNLINKGICEINTEGKNPVTIFNLDRLSKFSKSMNKEFEESIAQSLKVKADHEKYLENRYEYRGDEEGFFQKTGFNREDIRKLDQLLISNLKKDLFQDINEKSMAYIVDHLSTGINLVQLACPDFEDYKIDAGTDCDILLDEETDYDILSNRLSNEEIQKKLKILTVIQFHAPELLETFTKNELAFIKLVNNNNHFKIIDKKSEEAIAQAIAESKAKVDCTKYFEYRYEYRRDEEAFFDATGFNMEKTRELDQSLISNLKKDLFENINEETIENYISVQLSPSNYQFNKRREDCNLLFLRLDDKEIQKKLKIFTVIELHAPELLETFTESERKFIKLVNKYPSIDELDQLLISNLKKDLFENINKETIEYIVDQLFHVNCQFNEKNLNTLTSNPDCTLEGKAYSDCELLFKRLERLGDETIKERLKTLTLIESYAPEQLLNAFTENELAFIEIAARGGRAQKKPQ